MSRTYDEEHGDLCAVDVEDDGLNGGSEGCGGISMTVWYVIIGVVVAALLIVLIVCLTKKKKNKKPKGPAGAELSDDESIKLMQDTRNKIYKYKEEKGSAPTHAKEEAEKLKQFIKDTKPQAEKVPSAFPARETFLKLLDNQAQLADLDEKYYAAKMGEESQALLNQISESDKEAQILKAKLGTQLAEAQDARRRKQFDPKQTPADGPQLA